MAKDRFSNQKMDRYANVPAYTPSVKQTMVFTKEQKLYINNIYKNFKTRLTPWELNFVETISNSASYSKKQIDVFRKIISKLQ